MLVVVIFIIVSINSQLGADYKKVNKIEIEQNNSTGEIIYDPGLKDYIFIGYKAAKLENNNLREDTLSVGYHSNTPDLISIIEEVNKRMK